MLLWHNSFPNQDSIINLMNEEKPLHYFRTYNMAAVRVALIINLKLKYVEFISQLHIGVSNCGWVVFMVPSMLYSSVSQICSVTCTILMCFLLELLIRTS